MIHSDRYQKVR